MTRPHSDEWQQLTPEQMAQLDEACDAYEAACQRGEPRDRDARLAELPDVVQALAAAEFDRLDEVYRDRKSQAPVFDDLQHTSDHQSHAERDIGGPQAGEVLAEKYRLVELIGRGGMGAVWVAQQLHPVQRKVALKLVRPGMDSQQVLTRFEAERQALALMDHPNIAKVFDGGLTGDGRPFFVMELVKGVPITRFCDERKLTVRQRLDLIVAVCQAIQHAHQKGIIHRDIKPSNVLVALYDDHAVPKVIDFGLAKATGPSLTEESVHTGFDRIVGTPQYMSPEQATLNNLDIDTRSDVYALGVLLYELLTGGPPFSAAELKRAGVLEILRWVREVEPPRPSVKLSSSDLLPQISAQRGADPKQLTSLVRTDLDWIVMKALEKDRARRYATANALASDLLRALAGDPVEAHPPSVAYRLRKFARRHRVLLGTAAAVLSVLLIAIAGTSWGLVRARQAEVLANRRADSLEHNIRTLTDVFTDFDIRQASRGPEPIEAVLGKRLALAGDQLSNQSHSDPLVVAALQDRLGRSLLSLGQAEEAKALCGQAAATLAQLRGPDHPDTLTANYYLADAHLALTDFDQAVPLFEDTARRAQARLGEQHADTQIYRGGLGRAYQAAGKWAEALPLLQASLQRTEAARGPDDQQTLLALSNVADCQRALGHVDEAIPLLEKAVQRSKQTLGDEHPDALMFSNNLAGCYEAVGRGDDAVKLFEQVFTVSRKTLGKDHPDTLASMNNLATSLWRMGQAERALEISQECVDLRRAKFGPRHVSTLGATQNLAVMYLESGQADRAAPMFEEVLAAVREELGPAHPHALATQGNLAKAYLRSGQTEKALTAFDAWIDALRQAQGGNSPAVAGALAGAGFELLQAKQFAAAESRLRESLPLREQADPRAWTTFNTMSMLGGALLAQQKYDEAEPLLTRGFEGLRAERPSIPPAQANLLLGAVDRLIQLAVARGDDAQAAAWEKEKAALTESQ